MSAAPLFTEHSYQSKDGVALALDVFAPAAPSNETAIVLIHGGGWRAGQRQSTHRYAPLLAKRGFTAIALQYRLVPSAPWPAQVEDVLSALDWIEANKRKLGVQRIVLEGFSAGAHLSLMAGARAPEKIAAIIAFFAPSRLSIEPADGSEIKADRLLGPQPDARAADDASPITHLGPRFPPTFFLHGAGDWAISARSSTSMFDKLSAAGVAAELHVIASAHHEFSMQSSMVQPIQDEVIAFLQRVVLDPAAFARETEAENPFAKGPEFMAQMIAAAEANQSASDKT